MPRNKRKFQGTPISFAELERRTGIRLQYRMAGSAARGAFPGESPQSRSMAIAIANKLAGMGVVEAGAVGCLDRARYLLVAVSGKILSEVVDTINGELATIPCGMNFYLQDSIDDSIERAIDKSPSHNPACAERYLFSYRDARSPLVGLSVVWYGGTAQRLVPRSYESLSGASFQTMAPCNDCIAISPVMVNVARNLA